MTGPTSELRTSPTPFYVDDLVTVHHGDCLDVMRELQDASVDAVVTDPPYALNFMGRKWDRFDNGEPFVCEECGNDDAAQGYRLCTDCLEAADEADLRGAPMLGQQSQNWHEKATHSRGYADNNNVAFERWCRLWARECLRVLKPGGHLLAFGGTRTWHRLACAVEDAGFEVRDSIAWLYGSGFPKSLDVSKAIDKRPGVERHPEFAAHLRERMAAKGYTNTFDVAERVVGRRTGAVANWQKYQFPEAKWWPALRDLLDLDEETWGPVITEAERVQTGQHAAGLATGSAGVGGAGEGKERRDRTATEAATRWQGWGTALKPAFEPIVVGRKPLAGTVAANVLTHGTGALNIDACRTAGNTPGPARDGEASAERRYADAGGTNFAAMPGPRGGDDRGRWPTNVVLDESQAEALDAQTGVLTSGLFKPEHVDNGKAAGTLGAFTGRQREAATYGDSGGASRFFPTFRYEAKAPTDERPRDGDVAHPTVKPLDLMRWLVRLVTPLGGVVLEPFAGSGTTAEACVIEGLRCIAIEREPSYLPLIVARLSKPIQPDLFGGAA